MLEAFISDLSTKVRIPKGRYSNHSLHSTAITNLKQCKWSDKHVMSVSGHKSATSLNTHQKVNSEEKIKMGNTLAKFLIDDDKNPDQVMQEVENEYQHLRNIQIGTKCKIQATSQPMICAPQEDENPIPQKQQILQIPDYNQMMPKENTQPNFELSDTDIIQVLEDCECENQEMLMTQRINTSTSTMATMMAKKSSPRVPIFNNCYISGNITININKI